MEGSCLCYKVSPLLHPSSNEEFVELECGSRSIREKKLVLIKINFLNARVEENLNIIVLLEKSTNYLNS